MYEEFIIFTLRRAFGNPLHPQPPAPFSPFSPRPVGAGLGVGRVKERILCVFLALLLSACTPSQVKLPLSLASFKENEVEVSIQLEQDPAGQFLLAATFTPIQENLHLYSKDLPFEGQDGLGRPTLLELVPGSALQATGELTADVEPVIDPNDAYGLPLYPTGPVTLRLPVSLPEGDGWVDAQVSVTFMACTGLACRAPVIRKIVAIKIPSSGLLSKP